MKNIKISPSILSADFSQLGKEIKRLEDGGADMIHVDVMDGHFVPNLTIGPPVIKALRKQCSIQFDVHLMISPVHEYIEAYADAGADIITIHPEATDNLEASILKIKELNKKVGVSLNPESKIDLIFNLLHKIDLVLIMSVNPGFGGQKFMPEVLDKIKELKKIQTEKNITFDIEIDGGINFDNCKIAIDAGANILVSGTTIFKSNDGDIKININLLKSNKLMVNANYFNILTRFYCKIKNSCKKFYRNSNLYNKKISKTFNNQFRYKPSAYLLSSIIKYQKKI